MARFLVGPARLDVANDDTMAPDAAPAQAAPARDAVLRATLRHFAVYGLQAAERAFANAEAAFFSGNSREYQHWMAICRTLDRRMAARIQPVRRPF